MHKTQRFEIFSFSFKRPGLTLWPRTASKSQPSFLPQSPQRWDFRSPASFPSCLYPLSRPFRARPSASLRHLVFLTNLFFFLPKTFHLQLVNMDLWLIAESLRNGAQESLVQFQAGEIRPSHIFVNEELSCVLSGTQLVSASQEAESGTLLGKRKTQRRRQRKINSVFYTRSL